MRAHGSSKSAGHEICKAFELRKKHPTKLSTHTHTYNSLSHTHTLALRSPQQLQTVFRRQCCQFLCIVRILRRSISQLISNERRVKRSERGGGWGGRVAHNCSARQEGRVQRGGVRRIDRFFMPCSMSGSAKNCCIRTGAAPELLMGLAIHSHREPPHACHIHMSVYVCVCATCMYMSKVC